MTTRSGSAPAENATLYKMADARHNSRADRRSGVPVSDIRRHSRTREHVSHSVVLANTMRSFMAVWVVRIMLLLIPMIWVLLVDARKILGGLIVGVLLYVSVPLCLGLFDHYAARYNERKGK